MLRAVIAAAVVTLLAGASQAGATSAASAHSISLDRAERAVEQLALAYVGRRTKGFNELVGSEVRSQAEARCRRSGEHAATCTWRGLLYLRVHGEEVEFLWVSCSGSAAAELRGSRLRLQLVRAACLH